MSKSCNLGFGAFLGCVSSIVGALQLATVVIYYAELPPFFLFLSLVTGIFVFTLSCCIVDSIIRMVRTSVNISGKIGVNVALGSICILTTVNLLLLLMQCHWILDQKVLTDIGLFQLQCLKAVTDVSEGIFLIILTNSATLGISTTALILACFWKVKKHADIFHISVLGTNWVYENNSDNRNNIYESDMTLFDPNFTHSSQFGKTHVQLPKIKFKSTRKGTVSSNNQYLRNISSRFPDSPDHPLHTYGNALAASLHQHFKQSESSLVSLTSFKPTGVKPKSDHYY